MNHESEYHARKGGHVGIWCVVVLVVIHLVLLTQQFFADNDNDKRVNREGWETVMDRRCSGSGSRHHLATKHGKLQTKCTFYPPFC